MGIDEWMISRRRLLQWLAATGAAGMLPMVGAVENGVLQRAIPASGEKLPAIGMGTWLTFDVGTDAIFRERRCDVLRTFFEMGGELVDSSPMYGSSEAVVGHCLERLDNDSTLFSATKVWTRGRRLGVNQMEYSRRQWGLPQFDLMQIHNMLDWETHLETLKEMKAQGKIRYIGITTSHGRRHAELERVLAKEDAFDFVQFTYNLIDREVEQRLLPMAAERGLAVIINRPFRGGGLFGYVNGKPLPPWAAEFDCENWAQFFLKFIVSHPAVTCAIPATTRVDHMRENMGALRGRLPTAEMRQRMVRHFSSL
ncbi:MAG: aldo/keto reductase [Pseudomonadota bacterium]